MLQQCFTVAMLSPVRLITLAAVEDHAGVVGAAASMHLTPSAVSQQLRQLEREAGTALLDRSGRQVRLTRAGQRLAARGRTIGREVVLAGDDLEEWVGAGPRTIEVAAFQTVICRVIAPLLASGAMAAADLDVRVRELEGPPALEALHAGRVDVVMTEELLGATPAAGGRANAPTTRLLIDDRYRVVVPAAWTVPEDPDALRADLVGRPWITQGPGTAGGAMLADLERRWSFSARLVHVCTEYVSAVALAEAGVGATLAPHLALPDDAAGTTAATVGASGADRTGAGRSSPSTGGTASLRMLDGAPDLGMRRVRALCRPSRRPVAAIDRLLDLLATRATEIGLRAELLT